MSDTNAFTAMRVADRLRHRTAAPWEVFGERLRRYEVHLNGDRVEMWRSPIELEGYGIRLFREGEEALGVGGAAATDLSDAGVEASLHDAETVARYGRFPARRISLPGPGSHYPEVDVVDRSLWAHPVEAIETYVHDLLEPFHGRSGVRPSFGSVRATLVEATLANSEGLQRRYAHTNVELELAVKAFGGAEGAPAGEYWATRRFRRLPGAQEVHADVDRWCRVAEDVRHAGSPVSAATNVVLPPGVLADILPTIVGFRLSGPAQLRKMMPPLDARVGAPILSIDDNGLEPFALGTAPSDDEGVPQARRPLLEGGLVRGSLTDRLHAGALGLSGGGGNGKRESAQFPNWFHFAEGLAPTSTTLEVPTGTGGSDDELIEAAREGLYVEQLGYAFPDPVSGAFGGELRAAYRIQNGRLGEPVRGGTIGGVVFAPEGAPSLLSQVQAIGSSTKLVGGLKTAAWLVGGMTVAGA